MARGDTVMRIPARKTDLDGNAVFGFTCNQCLNCCHHKKIQVNPYEIARIAETLGITTTECIALYTTGNGSYLKFREDATCPFLDTRGCTIHAVRPLVCRLYPLSRHVSDTGHEWFSELQPQKNCTGIYLGQGSIRTYINEQNAEAYMQAADCYLNMLWKMMAMLENLVADVEEQPHGQHPDDAIGVHTEYSNWMDMDVVVDRYCQIRQTAFPDDIDEKMRMHLDALYFWINNA
ncbi:MAG: YkgJ family cysteine cluster protein [Chlorobium sp.]|nr:YkgJ family cysteine cluster protein [Chlorobium sp.]MCW8814779.1 YkgJ family cysteine cluster protein [Chlorobium sp.]MCW8820136.1 YkgJ family cysteine cluster protein [Ignavibacteriaceae bacterium]